MKTKNRVLAPQISPFGRMTFPVVYIYVSLVQGDYFVIHAWDEFKVAIFPLN
jgi:hypothetical protein